MLGFEEQIQSYSPQTNNPQPQPNTNPYAGFNVEPIQEPSFVSAEYPSSDKDTKKDALVQKKQAKEAETGCTRFCNKNYWKQYFKMTEENVKDRILATMIPPFKDQFMDEIKPCPDLYGPFWVMTTIIFLMGMVGNFANYITSKFSDQQVYQGYFFKLHLVRYALIFVYSFALGVPFTLFMMFKFMKCNDLGLPQVVCLYGYSMACFIPALLLCIIPIGILQWLLMTYALINSSFFLILSLKKHIEGLQAKFFAVIGMIVVLQLVFFLVTKFFFINVDPSAE